MPAVMMLEGLDDELDYDLDAFDDLGAGPPSIVVDLVREIANDRDIQLWLRKMGRHAAETAVSELKSAFVKVVSGPPSPPNPWVQGLVRPFLDPFKDGFVEVIKAKSKPFITGVGLAIAGGALLTGVLIGGGRRRCIERGRQQARAEFQPAGAQVSGWR